MLHTNTKDLLARIGLSEKEIAVYGYLLTIPTDASIIDIASGADLPRTTIYDVLEPLMAKGLVKVMVVGKRKSYCVTTPHQLFVFVQTRVREMSQLAEEIKLIIPELERLRNPMLPAGRGEVFVGADGVATMWQRQLEQTNIHTVSFMCSQELFALLQQFLMEQSAELAKQGIPLRILMQTQDPEPLYMKRGNMEVKGMKSRILPHAGVDIVGNSLGYFTGAKELTVELLEHPQTAMMHQALFDEVWDRILS